MTGRPNFREPPVRKPLAARARLYYDVGIGREGMEMSESSVIQVRIDARDKTRAARLFRRLGMSTSDAVRLFIAQAIREKGLPFLPHIPNAETRRALADASDGLPVAMEDLKRQWDEA